MTKKTRSVVSKRTEMIGFIIISLIIGGIVGGGTAWTGWPKAGILVGILTSIIFIYQARQGWDKR